jgi:hypothetical protein
MTPLRRLVATTGIALAITIPAAAQAPPADEDAALNRAAYAALLKADDLADLNIGVRVFKDGTALLWGSARPADAARAEGVLRSVPGIARVVNTCDPVPATDPVVEKARAAFPTPAPAKPDAPKLPELPVIVPPPAAPGAPVSRPTTAEKRAEEPAAVLLDPVAAGGPVDYAGIDRVRRSDPRFARLTFDLRDGRVVIAGTSTDPKAAWDLARQIAPLVGSRDVVIGRSK